MGINMHKNDIYMIENNKRSVKDYEIWGFMKILNITYDDSSVQGNLISSQVFCNIF